MDGDQGTGSGKRSMVSLIVGVALGVVIGLLVVWGLFCIYNRFFGEKAGTFVYTPF